MKPYVIIIAVGKLGPTPEQWAWMDSKLKQIVNWMEGRREYGDHPLVHLYPVTQQAGTELPTWITSKPRRQGTQHQDPKHPGLHWSPTDPTKLRCAAHELGSDEVWCLGGDGQTIFGPSVGSRAFRHLQSPLNGPPFHAHFIPSWVGVDQIIKPDAGTRKPKGPKTWKRK